MLQLNSQQSDWLSRNSDFTDIVYTFIVTQQFTTEAGAFAKEAVLAVMQGGEVDFEEAYISMPTPDDNYNYTGQKEYIPSTLTLDNGDEVNVEFGVTNSDNENANQEVATHLIDGMKYALNEANNNLSSIEKITEIYIMATTNGDHSDNSNHYNGTAVDISRINGNKMALSGVTDQIIELQEAFDNYQYVRENFGPHFKHKYSIETDSWNYNHPVGGHTSHIHFSSKTN